MSHLQFGYLGVFEGQDSVYDEGESPDLHLYCFERRTLEYPDHTVPLGEPESFLDDAFATKLKERSVFLILKTCHLRRIDNRTGSKEVHAFDDARFRPIGGGRGMRGQGQRVFLIDEEAIGIMEIGQIDFTRS